MSDLADNHINTRSLQAELTAKRDSGRKLLLPYVTAGIVGNWMDCVEAVIEAGADAVEIGIPFSDPAMDGPTIQQASVQALDNGITAARRVERAPDARVRRSAHRNDLLQPRVSVRQRALCL